MRGNEGRGEEMEVGGARERGWLNGVTERAVNRGEVLEE